MLSPPELPGIRGLASEVLAGLREGSLVSVSAPGGSAGRQWIAWLIEAIRGQARERGDPRPIDVQELSGSLTDPLAELSAAGCVGRLRNLNDLLEFYQDDGALVLVVECEFALSRPWKDFLDEIRRACCGAGSRRLRPVLAIVVGSREFPPITHDVGVRVYALWNTVRWEELRLFADSMLPRSENALTRAWRVATYSGAANGDPEALVRLCRESPDRLVQVVALALECSEGQPDLGGSTGILPEGRWSVPPSVIAPWAAGGLRGYTLERGPMRAAGAMAGDAGSRYLRAAIWREQLTGLFAVVVELGFHAANAITSALGPEWQKEIPAERKVSDGEFRMDPKEVLEIVSDGRFGRVPKSITSFLDLLRRTRNDLAHMSPVELQRIRHIWQGYDVICRRFANPRVGAQDGP